MNAKITLNIENQTVLVVWLTRHVGQFYVKLNKQRNW